MTESRAELRATALALAALLLALVAAWATPAPAYACSCGGSPEAELAQHAEVIFTGTVVADETNQWRQTRTFTVAVDRVYKGEATATQVVSTHASGASCGLEISGPGPFLIFADREGSTLTANLCGGTRAGSAPASMGAGHAPLPDAVPDARMGRWMPLVGLVLAATAAAVVGVSLIRRRSR